VCTVALTGYSGSIALTDSTSVFCNNFAGSGNGGDTMLKVPIEGVLTNSDNTGY